MKLALPFIIHPSQSFGIKGRSIQDNIIFLNALLAYIKEKNIPAIYLNIDQEKAFDRVSHNFSFETLKNFEFGRKFQKILKTLYKFMKSKILVNGHLSKLIRILRSVRQGCPIAPLLYILVIETILVKIRLNNSIYGIRSPCSNESFKLSAFADDTQFILKNEASARKVLEIFDYFGKASGAKINRKKKQKLCGWGLI